jgi:hypothetical protein
VAAPEPSVNAPLFPLLALPDEKTSMPLTPNDPAFRLRMATNPLVVAVPSPLATDTAPPVFTVLRPALTWTDPPAPLVPLPTESMIWPARPEVAAPDPRTKAPLLPLLELPLENIRKPLVPAVPAFMLRSMMVPLDVAAPSPLAKLKAPPVFNKLRPENT